jgi:hypothetical protein
MTSSVTIVEIKTARRSATKKGGITVGDVIDFVRDCAEAGIDSSAPVRVTTELASEGSSTNFVIEAIQRTVLSQS